jgi:hypothetical protein
MPLRLVVGIRSFLILVRFRSSFRITWRGGRRLYREMTDTARISVFVRCLFIS